MSEEYSEKLVDTIIENNRALVDNGELSHEEFVGYCLRELSEKGVSPSDAEIASYVRVRVVEMQSDYMDAKGN